LGRILRAGPDTRNENGKEKPPLKRGERKRLAMGRKQILEGGRKYKVFRLQNEGEKKKQEEDKRGSVASKSRLKRGESDES